MSTRCTALILCVLILFSGCGAGEGGTKASHASISAPDSGGMMSVEWPEGADPSENYEDPLSASVSDSAGGFKNLFPNALPLENEYIQTVTDDALSSIVSRDMDDIERLRAAYEWIIARTYFEEPVGLDIWRYRGDPDGEAPFVENRALSVLLWGLGECEDYAAAMVVLARRMGYEAEYVFGMTVSIHGEWVDHAWCVVKVGGLWYHLDPQLEDNIIRGGQIRNRYFMRGDGVMRADHLWGESLIAARRELSPEQTAKIREELTPPACRGNIEPSPPYSFVKAPRPSRALILQTLSDERAAYIEKNGPLPETELDTEPPMEIYDPEVY